MMNMKLFKIFLLSLCVADLFLLLAPAQAVVRPNIVLLMGDDHGWEETGYNGHLYVQTPVLDEMAASGLRFDRFYAAHPSCSPTRGSVLTGRHPNRYGTFAPNWSMRPEEITRAHLLADAGYATGHFGKWHVGPVKEDSPTNPGAMGFDEWLAHDNFFEQDPMLSQNGRPPRRLTGEGSAVVVDAAIRFIDRSQENGQSFLAVIWFASPHEPYSGSQQDLALYDELPGRYAEQTVSLTSNETGLPVHRPLRDVLRERYAEITAMDRAIGRLRQYLEDEGLRENTLLWYNGDNGTPPSGVTDMFLRGLKGTMYEGGIRVPGLIEWPARIMTPRVSQVPAVTSDILPTVASLVGQTIPARPLDGVDLQPLIDNSMVSRPEPLFFWSVDIDRLVGRNRSPYIAPELQIGTTPLVKLMDGISTRNFQNFRYPRIGRDHFGGQRAVLDNDYKLIIAGSEGSDRELFNLRDDSAEQINLVASEPAMVNALESELREWQRSSLESLMGIDYR